MPNDDIFTRLERTGLTKTATAHVATITPINGTVPEIDHPLVRAALDRRLTELSMMAPRSGRNAELNKAAAYLGTFPIPRAQLRELLLDACRANGLFTEDGELQCNNTINSGFKKADADGPRLIEDRKPTVLEVAATELNGNNTGDELTDAEREDLHAMQVKRRAYELRVNEDARKLYASEQAKELGRVATPPTPLVDFLAIPDSDAEYRIQDLLPIGGRALLAAQYKAGKTSLVDNLIRSLADGQPFLGRYQTAPATVTLIDTEIDERQLRRWLRTHRIDNMTHVKVKPLRGEVSTFNILDEATRKLWGSWLTGSDIIILDCLRPCLDALGLSEDKDAGKFLVAFDELLKTAGASEGVLVHHMGHSGERSRGDSRLLDWPDVTWRIIKDKEADDPDNPDVQRFFSAYGRDVNVGEGLLDYSHETRELTYMPGSRASHQAQNLLPHLHKLLREQGAVGMTANEIEGALKGLQPRKIIREAVASAIENGSIFVETEGKSHARRHFISPAWAG